MNFRILKLLAAIYISLSLFAGYWDMRLSDQFLYHGQMAQIHYYRTLQAHAIAGILVAAALTFLFTLRKQPPDRQGIIANHTAWGAAGLTFLIFGVKTHLVWLRTHLMDPEGLLWTAVVIGGSIVVFFSSRWIVQAILRSKKSKLIAGTIFLLALLITSADAYLKNRKPDARFAFGKPNIVLIMIDTLRADHMTSYSSEQKTTPNLQKLEKESVLYEYAFSTSPWTTPSHASLFTGQYPSKNGVDGRNIIVDPSSTTLAEVLAKNGYQTAGFINNVYIRRQTGLGRGFEQYEEFWGRNEGSSIMLLIELLKDRLRPERDSGASETRRAVNNWLRYDWSGKNPFFLFIHLMEPHAIYGIPDDYYKDFLPENVSAEQAEAVNQDPELYICEQLKMDAKDFEILRALYNNDIRYVDEQIGLILDDFKQRGLLDQTMLAVTADHGEHFGEHGLMSHELSVYDDLIRVPLMIRFPSKKYAASRIADIVQLTDIFPSILQLANISTTGLHLQGYSLLPESMKRREHPVIFAEYDNARAVDKIERKFPQRPAKAVYARKVLKMARNAQYKYIWGSDGTREFYDTVSDPKEMNNLYDQKPEAAKEMEALLSQWLSSFKPSGFYKQEEVSKEALEELRSLGYVQ